MNTSVPRDPNEAKWSLLVRPFNLSPLSLRVMQYVKPDALYQQFQRFAETLDKPEAIIPASCIIIYV